jgi:hypothetical protein
MPASTTVTEIESLLDRMRRLPPPVAVRLGLTATDEQKAAYNRLARAYNACIAGDRHYKPKATF